jgi:hypothetical protein
MTPSILHLRQMNSISHSSGFDVRSSDMRLGDHCFKLWRLHDPSIRRDYVVMTDRPVRLRE